MWSENVQCLLLSTKKWKYLSLCRRDCNITLIDCYPIESDLLSCGDIHLSKCAKDE